jgi:orotidine 5'-phosphate decarboxylase subfamily 2
LPNGSPERNSSSGSLVCVGLDPDPAKLPKDLAADRAALLHSTAASSMRRRHRRRLQAADRVLQRARAEAELAASIRYIRERAPHALVILDAKRGDIGNTAEAYAREAFERYGADAVTVNPYMGEDSVRPFLARPDRGAILLCRTSNPGAKDFQDLLSTACRCTGGRGARRRHWNEHRNLMLVVGATYPARNGGAAPRRIRNSRSWCPASARRAAISRHCSRRAWTRAAGTSDQRLAQHHLCGRRRGGRDPRRRRRSQASGRILR